MNHLIYIKLSHNFQIYAYGYSSDINEMYLLRDHHKQYHFQVETCQIKTVRMLQSYGGPRGLIPTKSNHYNSKRKPSLHIFELTKACNALNILPLEL